MILLGTEDTTSVDIVAQVITYPSVAVVGGGLLVVLPIDIHAEALDFLLVVLFDGC